MEDFLDYIKSGLHAQHDVRFLLNWKDDQTTFCICVKLY